MWLTCASTVRREMNSRSAMSRLDRPPRHQRGDLPFAAGELFGVRLAGPRAPGTAAPSPRGHPRRRAGRGHARQRVIARHRERDDLLDRRARPPGRAARRTGRRRARGRRPRPTAARCPATTGVAAEPAARQLPARLRRAEQPGGALEPPVVGRQPAEHVERVGLADRVPEVLHGAQRLARRADALRPRPGCRYSASAAVIAT